MTAGEGDLEPAPRLELATHLREVGNGKRRSPHRRRGLCGRRWARGCVRDEVDPRRDGHAAAPGSAANQLHRVAERRRADRLDALDQGSFGKPVRRNHDPPQPATGQRGDHRQDPRHGPDLAAQ